MNKWKKTSLVKSEMLFKISLVQLNGIRGSIKILCGVFVKESTRDGWTQRARRVMRLYLMNKD